MVDSVTPPVRPPVQVVAPLPPEGVDESEEEEEEEAPANPPPQVARVQVAPTTPPTTPAAGPSTEDGLTAATAVEIIDSSDSDSD